MRSRLGFHRCQRTSPAHSYPPPLAIVAAAAALLGGYTIIARPAVASVPERNTTRTPATTTQPTPAKASPGTAPRIDPNAPPPGDRVASVPRFESKPSRATELRSWQLLPEPLFMPYLAAQRESRLAQQWFYSPGRGIFWDGVLGGRTGLLRYGTKDHPDTLVQGYQLDMEAAALVRLDFDKSRDLVAADFRVGVPFVISHERWLFKVAFYHLSSHLGDEYWRDNPDREPTNYSRDVFLGAVAYRFKQGFRVYGEAGLAWLQRGPARLLELQTGAEYTPEIGPGWVKGSPWAAVNLRLDQGRRFVGTATAQAGWQWTDSRNMAAFRVGFHYMNGFSSQYQFFEEREQQIGWGTWIDF